MLNINNLKNGNLNSTNSDNVVELNNSEKFVCNNSDKIDYAFNMLEQSGYNPANYMYMYEDNSSWYFKESITREYVTVSKISYADLTPSEIIESKTIDCLPKHAKKRTIFTPEIRQLSNGDIIKSVNDWNILAEDTDETSLTFGEFTDKIGSTVTPDYNYFPMVEKIKMFNEQISDKFSDYLINSDSVEIKQSTAHNGGYYKANYIFKDIYVFFFTEVF